MRAAIQDHIDAILARLRTAAGAAWVEPARVYLTARAKMRPGRGDMLLVWEVEMDAGNTAIKVEFNSADVRRKGDVPRERITTRARG